MGDSVKKKKQPKASQFCFICLTPLVNLEKTIHRSANYIKLNIYLCTGNSTIYDNTELLQGLVGNYGDISKIYIKILLKRGTGHIFTLVRSIN